MDFKTYFKTCNYLLAACGFVALLIAGRLNPVLEAVMIVSLPAGWYLEYREWGKLSRRIANILGIAVLLFAAASLFFLSSSLVMVAIHLLILLQLIKLFSPKTNRDYLQIYALSFLQLIGASILTLSALFSVVFVAFVILLAWTLILYTLKVEAEGEEDPLASQVAGDAQVQIDFNERLEGVIHPSFFVGSSLVIVVVFISTLVFFFSLPRLGAGYLEGLAGGRTARTGFSDVVQLGDIGRLLRDDSIAMRVDLKVPPGEDLRPEMLLWRGATLDEYRDKAWRSTLPALRRISAMRRSTGQRLFLIDPQYRGVRISDLPSGYIRQDIYLEPTTTRFLFGLPTIGAVEGGFGDLHLDRGGSIFRNTGNIAKLKYTVYSKPSSRASTSVLIGSIGRDADLLLRYLKLPDENFTRMKTLARSLTAGYRDPLAKAKTLEAYFIREFGYTFDTSRIDPQRPLESFLFDVRAGYCEYFASSMALMLRTLGIPSRVVTGYRGGEYNEYGGYYIIRQSNAHAWVEAYVPGRGWVAFDPTPPDPNQGLIARSAENDEQTALEGGTVGAKRSWLHRLPLYLDAYRMFWMRYFVSYDLEDQVNLARGFRARSQRIESQLHRPTQSLTELVRRGKTLLLANLRYVIGVGLIVVVVALALIRRGGLGGRGLGRGSLAPARRGPVTDLYRRFLKHLARKGFKRNSAWTPLEFARRIDDPRIAEWVERVTELYYRLRYDGENGNENGNGAESVDQLKREIAAVKRELSRIT
ncbi:MAG: DUF3488 and DUF4129 domain-containing transglutaminase family protein [Candidatus Bipolaricaulia bacterium]